jgi:predicted O-methyltransferase YrrM
MRCRFRGIPAGCSTCWRAPLGRGRSSSSACRSDSTLHLAAALRDNGGGRLITTEFESSKIARARANLAAGTLSDLVEICEGDALETLASDLPEAIDLLLLDGAKALYRDVLATVESRLRRGAVIIADNADHCPEYLEYVRDPANGYLTLPFTEDVELTIRLN